MRAWNGEAPYDRNGNLCHHESDGIGYETTGPGPRDYRSHGPDWKPVAEFTATLAYDGYSRGRSAAYVWWKDTATGIRYPMFMADLDAVLASDGMSGKHITGRFVPVKRGQNFGLSYLGPAA